ncbi:sugar phosphate isomerase/epimerase [Novosphingobium flavum]|uniref:sugar phosphate isomerase/epimerase family protein n=1 Tax=Novosphingobium aerophilum TaxID=2839843 RepID=UPI00163B1D65|nr:TIM barrel protein [Novosphingobium aerophilum]MBC2660225.1 sugar phosphate isomerase/epimerase [Novosphingobium aerophilum]
MTRRLALDHITVPDAGPVALVELAAATGCAGIGLFLHPMEVLPLMPAFELIGSAPARRELRAALRDRGVTLDLAYPFTLASRTELAGLLPTLDCAAELEAEAINVLVYDRDPARRADHFAGLCDLARARGLNVAVEFFPASQVPSLAAAIDLVAPVDRPGEVGINVDLLHLMRSHTTLAQLAAAPAGTVLYAQVADGPIAAPSDPAGEARGARRLVGDGVFDVAGFVAALPSDCPISVEIPRDALVGQEPALTRAKAAVASLRRALGEG